ncbi:unnamed protein product [Ostreobium quekettii]|uniref:Uncharacterized protein n=1 Tax=Ostreobium quekettii TaxID=121088 RepID=A0A8S1JAK6_9CHLO|nr:unnamed protein product [Ostreobium quekettii]|eukprot:evm.model.scf_771.6 EVM.evm.TU.scf_771.6   scf_771:44987-47843(-)
MDEYAPGSPRASADLFRYRVSLGQGRSLAVLSDPLHAWGYCIGASLWSAAQELAVYLAGFRRGWLSGKGVLELGAGLGVPGQISATGGCGRASVGSELAQTPLLTWEASL